MTDITLIDLAFADPAMLLVSSDPLLNHRLSLLDAAADKQKIINRIVRMLLIEHGEAASPLRKFIMTTLKEH